MKKGEENGNKFKIQIEGESVNGDNEWEIKDLNNGRYEVKIKMNHEGRYFIFVQYNGIDLPSSPLQIQVFPKQRNYSEINEPKLIFGSKGDGNGQFKLLKAICVDLHDNILVCDYNNNRIHLFDSNGKVIRLFKLSLPTDITIDPKTQNIIVCGENNTISIL